MKVFLDDWRMPEQCIHYMYKRIGKDNPLYLETWEIVRNYHEFIAVVEKNIDIITHVSFDHDLAEVHYDPERFREIFTYYVETGYDCAVWMKDFYNKKNMCLPIIFVHSENDEGAEKIGNVFES